MTSQVRGVSAKIVAREKQILAGLYLSKFNSLALKNLGFNSFVEAFNVIGYTLGSRAASIKNYRDEFDPLSNTRKGWHKRPIRSYCREIYDKYAELSLEEFTEIVRSFLAPASDRFDENTGSEVQNDGASIFAQRLITGIAAEHYFESIHTSIPEFQGYSAENTTQFGCGYDFRLRRNTNQDNFLAVEVKGLRELTGSVSMTPKEHNIASVLGDRYYLFVVRNFREIPSHSIFQNPLSSGLGFRKLERILVQISWTTNV